MNLITSSLRQNVWDSISNLIIDRPLAFPWSSCYFRDSANEQIRRKAVIYQDDEGSSFPGIAINTISRLLPTEIFKISKAFHPSQDVSDLHRNRQSPDFEALKLWNLWSGWPCFIFGYKCTIMCSLDRTYTLYKYHRYINHTCYVGPENGYLRGNKVSFMAASQHGL